MLRQHFQGSDAKSPICTDTPDKVLDVVNFLRVRCKYGSLNVFASRSHLYIQTYLLNVINMVRLRPEGGVDMKSYEKGILERVWQGLSHACSSVSFVLICVVINIHLIMAGTLTPGEQEAFKHLHELETRFEDMRITYSQALKLREWLQRGNAKLGIPLMALYVAAGVPKASEVWALSLILHAAPIIYVSSNIEVDTTRSST
jgi:hypothetical protein